MLKVLAFAKYGAAAASTRQRLIQYFPHLAEAGIEVRCQSLLDNDYVESIANGIDYPRRYVALAYAKRLEQMISARQYDVLWVYAELFPFLPAAFEKLAFWGGKPVVYDFDDAFFHQYDDNPHPLFRVLLSGKLRPLMKGAAVCCCGNRYLQEYARRFSERTMVLPTVVDTECYRPKKSSLATEPPVIGWIGSPTTWPNVRFILPVLRELVESGAARVRVIGAGRTAERDRFPGLELVEWSQHSEIMEVQRMDIGIMPLLDLPFHRGKSGYKLIQYMACGLPVVASPVGVNTEIVLHGETGYLAQSLEEWKSALCHLLGEFALRQQMGAYGRTRAEMAYSLRSQAPRLIEVFRSII